MKKIISTCIALMVSAACSISAFAMEVPTNTTIQDLNGVRQYIKIYTVAPDTDPQSLIDDVFEYDGYTYTYRRNTAVHMYGRINTLQHGLEQIALLDSWVRAATNIVVFRPLP